MATLNLTPDTLLNDTDTNTLLRAAVTRGSNAAYRSAVNWQQATKTERTALCVLRKAMTDTLSDDAADNWFARCCGLATATDRERGILDLADCAVESMYHCAAESRH